MRLHFFLALALLAPAVAAQSFDETLASEPAAPDATQAPETSEASPPDTSDTVPLSAFEAIQPPPPLGLSPDGAATAAPPLRLQIDPELSPIGPYTPPPPVAPRIPGRDAEPPRSPTPSDWR